MADEHALAERLPREMLGRLQPARKEESALVVGNVGIAVDDGRVGVAVGIGGHGLQRLCVVEAVAGIHEHHIVARGAL